MPNPTTGRRSRRQGCIGCSAARMPRTMFWACVIAFIAAGAVSIAGLVVAPSTALGVATMLVYAAWAISLLVAGAWVGFPESFRRNR